MSILSSDNPRDLLARVHLFSELPAEDLDRLAGLTRRIKLPAERALFHQGEEGDEMFILASGEVEIQVQLRDGKTVTRGRLSTGESFGEVALFDGRPRSASVLTREASEFLVLDRTRFREVLREYPDIAIRLLESLMRRFRAMDEAINETLVVDIPKKLAKGLMHLVHGYGQQTRKGMRIDAPFTDQELSELAGLSAELVTAQLDAWKREGIIKRESQFITIRDMERFERIAEMG